eukprot:6213379-Pleurochrysis_carterae.AAC.2
MNGPWSSALLTVLCFTSHTMDDAAPSSLTSRKIHPATDESPLPPRINAQVPAAACIIMTTELLHIIGVQNTSHRHGHPQRNRTAAAAATAAGRAYARTAHKSGQFDHQIRARRGELDVSPSARVENERASALARLWARARDAASNNRVILRMWAVL